MIHYDGQTANSFDATTHRGCMPKAIKGGYRPRLIILRLLLLRADDVLANFSIDVIQGLVSEATECGVITPEERIHICARMAIWREEHSQDMHDVVVQRCYERQDKLTKRYEDLPKLGYLSEDRETFATRHGIPQKVVDKYIALMDELELRHDDITRKQFLLLAPDLAHLLPSFEFIAHASINSRDDKELDEMVSLARGFEDKRQRTG